uniref:serine/threonine-protein phosphatase PGAM5, mitochondrial n=1 Tax=Ciona intestinalis TaxID=7719 RepID=UPI000180CED3|nr:serine/threonine-protein phosphatase PGAM5, mitochondrial [Ciona intestinalis]|eukprot:XP_002132166.1 serine/threonine-protein phosphatase PGAM5, mitochondrial [Ciona intestinalis]
MVSHKMLRLATAVTGGCGTLLLYFKLNCDTRNTASAASVEPSCKWDSDWDKRANDKAKATRNIILIRHGQYNLAGSGDKERYLTELGKEQAIRTGIRLKELGLAKLTTHFVKSTMTRAQQTGDLIYKQLENDEIPVEDSDLIREGAPVEPEPPIQSWNPDPKTFFLDGARIETAFRHFIHRANPEQEFDSTEVIVCHGNVIRYFVCRALQLPPEAWLRLSLRHGSITWLSVRPNGRVSIKCLGDSGHLPADKLTFE